MQDKGLEARYRRISQIIQKDNITSQDTYMMNEKEANSVYEVETSLDKRLGELQSQLKTHNNTLKNIEETCKNSKDRAKQMHDASISRIEKAYVAVINTLDSETEASKRAARERLQSTTNSHREAEIALRTNQEASVVALNTLKKQWDTYIDRVHEEFVSSIISQKKSKTKDLENRLEELTKRKNRYVASSDDRVNYERKSPLGYALSHPFVYYPKWWKSIRTTMIIAGIIWIVLVIVKGVRCVNNGESIEDLYSSPWITKALFVLCIYWACAYFIGFFHTIKVTSINNDILKSDAVLLNKKLVADKASAAEDLKKFEERYAPIFRIGGKWNFDWQRCPIGKTEADTLMASVIKRNASLHPKQTPRGISEYNFEIDYNALH